MKVETSLGVGELSRTITNRLERNDIGVVNSRHCNWKEERVDDWLRGVGVGKGLTAG